MTNIPDYPVTDWVDNVTPVDAARMDQIDQQLDLLNAELRGRLGREAKIVTDWNTAVESGWYFNANFASATNGPGGDLYVTLVLNPADTAEGVPGDFIVQIAYDLEFAGRSFIRQRMFGTWQPWITQDYGERLTGFTVQGSPSAYNSMTKSGWQDMAAAATNAPAAERCLLFCLADDANNITQIAYAIGGTMRAWMRRRVAGTWDGAWTAIWPLSGGGVDYKGAWSSVTAYAQGDVVLYQGREYIAVNPGTNQTPPTPPAPGPTVISLVTALPTSPFDGQEVHFTDSLTTPTFVWHLRYVAAAPSNKWKFVGGPSLVAEVATSEATSSTSYVALTTPGPSITLPVAGDYIVRNGFYGKVAATSQTYYMSYDIGGTAAADADAVIMQPGSAGDPGFSNARTRKKLGLGAVALVAKYRTSGGTGPSFINRWMEVEPIAVGG